MGDLFPLSTLLPTFLAATIAKALGTSFLLVQGRDNNATALGPGSSWGDVENPQNYTLRGSPSPVPDPVAIEAMDGVVLGTQLAQGPLSVAELLRSNYGTGNGLEVGRPPHQLPALGFGGWEGDGEWDLDWDGIRMGLG